MSRMKHAFNFRTSSHIALPAMVLASAVLFAAGCTNETSRRSAVDSTRFCDPSNPYSCVATAGLPAPSASRDNPITRPKEDEVVAVKKDDEKPKENGPSTPAASPVPAAPPAPAAPVAQPADPAAEKAKALKELTEAIGKVGDAVADNIKKGGTPASEKEGTKAQPYMVTFTKDSFVGVADGTVSKNCFISAGTSIEVSSAPERVTNFSSLGVDQNLAKGVVTVTPASGASGCNLVGTDVIFIGSHATAQPKP